MALVLWRCPVCVTDDALVHKRPLIGRKSVICNACGTRWGVRREIGKDCRLKVVDGPSDVVGLEMSLSAWYDEMRAGFELRQGERVYLDLGDVPLAPYRPHPLCDGYTGRQPPQTTPRGRRAYSDFEEIGEGRLLLTDERILWQGPDGELDFEWADVTAVHLWKYNDLGIRYGSARYGFSLGDTAGLKGVTYAAALGQLVADRDGHEYSTSTVLQTGPEQHSCAPDGHRLRTRLTTLSPSELRRGPSGGSSKGSEHSARRRE